MMMNNQFFNYTIIILPYATLSLRLDCMLLYNNNFKINFSHMIIGMWLQKLYKNYVVIFGLVNSRLTKKMDSSKKRGRRKFQ